MDKKILHRLFDVLLVAGIVAAYSFRVYFPLVQYYDEVYYVSFVRELLYQQHYSTGLTTHPPLAHLVDGLFFVFFGDYSAVWRLSALLSGFGVLYLIYRLALTLCRNGWAARAAVILYAADCISLTQARIEMPNALMQLLMLTSLWGFLQYEVEKRWTRRKAYLWAGSFLGLALATKMTAVSLLFLYAGIWLVRCIRSFQSGRVALITREALACFIGLPILLFFACHLFIPFLSQHDWSDIWKIQVIQMQYHFVVAPTQTHGYSSAWWGWPFLVRPIWYHYQQMGGVVTGILCIGNPVLFWSIPLVIGGLVWDWARRRQWVSGFVLWGFLSQWLFFAFGARIKFFHYFDAAMPFVVLAASMLLARIWRQGKWGKWVALSYIICVVGMFLYWYPLLTGWPISEAYFRQHMWFRSWI